MLLYMCILTHTHTHTHLRLHLQVLHAEVEISEIQTVDMIAITKLADFGTVCAVEWSRVDIEDSASLVCGMKR